MVTILPNWEGYRTRLTDLLGLDEEASAKAIASSVYSCFVRQLLSQTLYPLSEMANPFEAYHKELIQSDRDSKTIERYWQIVASYQKWLEDRQPDVPTIKEFLAYLRDKGYRPKSVLLYYHALKLFLEFIGLPLLRSPPPPCPQGPSQRLPWSG